MDIRLEELSAFTVYGYAVETDVEHSGEDISKLWVHKDELIALGDGRMFGVMWYTVGHRYYYLLGIRENNEPSPAMIKVDIPAGRFAVARCPRDMTPVQAWTQYFEQELPALGLTPDAAHGKYFERHGLSGLELWTPVVID